MIAPLAFLLLQVAVSENAGLSPLREADLAAAAIAAERHPARDKFADERPNDRIAGRPFRVSLPLFEAGIGVGLKGDGMAGSWDYDKIHHTLILDVREQMWPYVEMMTREIAPHGLDGFYLNYRLSNGRSYAAENAFGAHAVISTYHATGVALAYVRTSSDDQIGMPPPRDELGFHYRAELPMDGQQARQLVSGIRFIAEGHVSTFAGGSNVSCGSVAGDPTMMSRIDLSTTYCVIPAQFSRVSFQDAKGNVLTEWKSPVETPTGSTDSQQN